MRSPMRGILVPLLSLMLSAPFVGSADAAPAPLEGRWAALPLSISPPGQPTSVIGLNIRADGVANGQPRYFVKFVMPCGSSSCGLPEFPAQVVPAGTMPALGSVFPSVAFFVGPLPSPLPKQYMVFNASSACGQANLTTVWVNSNGGQNFAECFTALKTLKPPPVLQFNPPPAMRSKP